MDLLDTNVVSEMRKPRPHGAVLAWLDSVEDANLHPAAVTLGEIQAGTELTRQPARAWAHRAEAPPDVVPRILLRQLAARLLAPADSPDPGPDPAVLLGRLKTARAVEGAHMEWSMDPLLDHLQSLLPPDDHALLTALVAALSFPDQGADLHAIPAWSTAAPQPLE